MSPVVRASVGCDDVPSDASQVTRLETERIRSALRFLSAQQAGGATAFETLLRKSDGSLERETTVFANALILKRLKVLNRNALFHFLIFEDYPIASLIRLSSDFLKRSESPVHPGFYAFWPPGASRQAEVDLDDTALVKLALLKAQPFKPDDQEGLQEEAALFAAHRYNRGMRLSSQSLWAEAYPGVFSTWKLSDKADPLVIDAVALAHIACYLLSSLNNASDAKACPGVSESLALLHDLLTRCLEALKSGHSLATVEASLALSQRSPYYRSLPRLLSACAALGEWDEGIQSLVFQILAMPACTVVMADFSALLWLADAFCIARLPVPHAMLQALKQAQQDDGGWPELELCSNLQGDWRWSSRSLATAIALQLFTQSATNPPDALKIQHDSQRLVQCH